MSEVANPVKTVAAINGIELACVCGAKFSAHWSSESGLTPAECPGCGKKLLKEAA